MKNYSIFKDTMADMSYIEVEQLIENEAVVLFPIAVIEEHGPHLPLGTDTYITYSAFRHTQEVLSNMNVNSVIAPPFYWGINSVTGGFAGSFTVKAETMKLVIKDSIECLANWGFEKVFLLNMHGDIMHIKTIVEVAKEIHESEMNIDIYYIMPEFHKTRCGLSGDEPYILVIPKDEEVVQPKDQEVKQIPKYIDVHGGGFETSLMLVDYYNLVDVNQAKELKSSETTVELFRKWQQGGHNAKEVTPLGYCGDPSNISIDGARKFIRNTSIKLATIISDTI